MKSNFLIWPASKKVCPPMLYSKGVQLKFHGGLKKISAYQGAKWINLTGYFCQRKKQYKQNLGFCGPD